MNNRPRSLLFVIGVAMLPTPARANFVLDKVIVDLQPEAAPREDIELSNEGEERMYVSVEPSEIVNPDRPGQVRSPIDLGKDPVLLVSPRRLVLEPGERRLVRIALIGPRPGHEQVFRVKIAPVAGNISSDQDGLKVMVGYDTLVLVRPDAVRGSVTYARTETGLTLTNNANISYEYFDGKACRTETGDCRDLLPNRLYSGETWEVAAGRDERIEFVRSSRGNLEKITFDAPTEG